MSIKNYFIVLALMFFIAGGEQSYASEGDYKIWRTFVNKVKKGTLVEKDILPFEGITKKTLLDFTKLIKNADQKELQRQPEVYRVGEYIHFILQLTENNQSSPYCFTFWQKQGKWYFHNLESILIRFDKIHDLPTSEFPELPEAKKTWMREEIRVTNMVKTFNVLRREKDEQFALNHFKDGRGYLVGAITWVPFFEPWKAWIYYLCWLEKSLYGSDVKLLSLSPHKAQVELRPIYFQLYRKTGHLKEQISFSTFKSLFENIYQDRAEKAGWKLKITYLDNETCRFDFSR